MEKLMSNPYAWSVLSLCTVFSLIFAIYTWIVGRKTKEISVDYFSNEIIKQGKNPISKLNIEFEGKPIQDLTSTIFYIWNSGSEVINHDDVVEKSLKIKCKSESFLDVQVIRQSDDSNNFSVLNFTSTNIELIFDYMDSGEGVRLQILHTESSDDLFVNCKIKGGRPIRNCIEMKKNKGIRGFWRSCLDELFPILIIALGFYCTIVVSQFMGFPYKEYEIFVLIVSIVVGVILFVLYLKMKKKVKNVLHRTIPSELR